MLCQSSKDCELAVMILVHSTKYCCLGSRECSGSEMVVQSPMVLLARVFTIWLIEAETSMELDIS